MQMGVEQGEVVKGQRVLVFSVENGNGEKCIMRSIVTASNHTVIWSSNKLQ